MNFFDTNILIYAQTIGPKRETALDEISAGGLISVQVINEFIHVMRQKSGRSWPEIEEALLDFDAAFPPPLPLTRDDQKLAVQLSRDHQISIYDGMIVAVAKRAGCSRLYSEDLQHERKFGALVVVNPFA